MHSEAWGEVLDKAVVPQREMDLMAAVQFPQRGVQQVPLSAATAMASGHVQDAHVRELADLAARTTHPARVPELELHG